ncbi:hypothetical protein K458DRAFT_489562 [Lentithecium fluviatile CBS 122367]|uniref:Uncharacterized protein n=1 Tax=Lentithecium fluviatile CBS 122367 TaxID=1168545 RepID=A0A6G1IS44_9PLEO|nr:hypothetical protein K458DRAFT_489562 [Lentithecium fluviatile CBS 122367]
MAFAMSHTNPTPTPPTAAALHLVLQHLRHQRRDDEATIPRASYTQAQRDDGESLIPSPARYATVPGCPGSKSQKSPSSTSDPHSQEATRIHFVHLAPPGSFAHISNTPPYLISAHSAEWHSSGHHTLKQGARHCSHSASGGLAIVRCYEMYKHGVRFRGIIDTFLLKSLSLVATINLPQFGLWGVFLCIILKKERQELFTITMHRAGVDPGGEIAVFMLSSGGEVSSTTRLAVPVDAVQRIFRAEYSILGFTKVPPQCHS